MDTAVSNIGKGLALMKLISSLYLPMHRLKLIENFINLC